ncbi:hypothetical protein LSH36_1965g00001 [Paralvinella palmiformis]|uniref:Ig-like domain-containing protein n=1 Tax=Paralvinella palmiformis TaxID=53620 RepID=A0AAD9IRR8_9ANNE|nr:hypothetical protein LSH36_1965g00001 [Paralvinella palmiformis]
MICSTRSTTILPNNLPSDLKPIMKYRWQRDNKSLSNDGRHIMSGNTLTIDKLQIQDNSITYICIAQEYGSKFNNYREIKLNVMLLAKWYDLYPEDMIRIVNIGDTTNFKVWIIARPLPRQDQCHWMFSSCDYYDNISRTCKSYSI